jgi:hypothetical protein
MKYYETLPPRMENVWTQKKEHKSGDDPKPSLQVEGAVCIAPWPCL